MKKIIRTVFVAVLMLGTTNGFASIKNSSNALNIRKENKEQLVIIKDVRGNVVHTETITPSDHNTLAFDLSTLKDGLYNIEYDKSFEIKVESFVVKSHKVIYLNNTETTIFKPVVRIENGKVLISKISFENDPLKIQLYFENELIVSEELSGEDILSRVYNLKENINGNYKLILTSKDRVFRKSFKI